MVFDVPFTPDMKGTKVVHEGVKAYYAIFWVPTKFECKKFNKFDYNM